MNRFADGERFPAASCKLKGENKMKLSKNSKEWVAKSVRDAFAEELKKANDAVKAEEDRRKELIKSFRAEADKVLASARKEVEGIAKRMKFTFHDDKRIDHLAVFASDSRYDTVDANTFEETRDCCEKLHELRQHVGEIEADIRTAVSKAIFEVEVHGKKDTLATIVDQVIREIKEGK